MQTNHTLAILEQKSDAEIALAIHYLDPEFSAEAREEEDGSVEHPVHLLPFQSYSESIQRLMRTTRQPATLLLDGAVILDTEIKYAPGNQHNSRCFSLDFDLHRARGSITFSTLRDNRFLVSIKFPFSQKRSAIQHGIRLDVVYRLPVW